MNTKKLSKTMLGILAFSLAATLLFATLNVAKATTKPGYNGFILFEANTDGNYDIYTFNPNTSATTKIIGSSDNEWGGVWSPDNSQIAFQRNVSGNTELFIANSNGSNQINITNDAAPDTFPKWTPDGEAIIFLSERSGSNQVYRYTIATEQTIPLTNLIDAYAWGSRLEISPDGSLVAFTKMNTQSGITEVYVIDSSTLSAPINTVPTADNPKWLPDGTGLVYVDESGGGSRIARYTLSDESISYITNGSQDDYDPAISPDGNQIAYISWRNDRYEARTIQINSSSDMAIQYNYGDYAISSPGAIGWSPDGNYILLHLYESDWSSSQFYIAPKDGSLITPITSGNHYVDYSVQPMTGLWQTIENSAPITSNDTLITSQNTSSQIDVLANDTDEEALDGTNLTITVQPSNGTASIVDGEVRYVPSTDFQGGDSLTYQICDSFILDQKCATGTLNITVEPSGAAPVIAVTTIAGINFNVSTGTYFTSNLRPTFSGTASPGAEVRVEIHSDPIVLTTIANGSGLWSVTPSFDLPLGAHMVYISATSNGSTTQLDSFGLTIQSASLAQTGVNLWMVVAMGAGVMIIGSGLLLVKVRGLK